ncbi:MAG: hypothetical protein Q7Q71_05285 [Verrucomicrobiota bacterium JB023]|nr:hypothetical protein [Verrucomicrobiota bacterium JB023]
MRAVLTILWDSLQLLRARMLFWVVIWISVLVGLLYASIGFDQDGISMLFGISSFENPLMADPSLQRLTYLLLFTNFISPWWLGFFAVLLSLIASCSVFPELMREGSIENILSKPIPRWKIFIVKYIGILGFMALPLTLFCLIVFFAMGLRVGVWSPRIFLAVPLLTFVFSILYSFAVLVGVWTRSTLFALLSAVLLYGTCYLVHFTESLFYALAIQAPAAGQEVNLGEPEPIYHDEPLDPVGGLVAFYDGLRKTTWLLPKPRKATLYLKQLLLYEDELDEIAGIDLLSLMTGQRPDRLIKKAQAAGESRMEGSEIFLPSILFQAVCLGGACWIFQRRDF